MNDGIQFAGSFRDIHVRLNEPATERWEIYRDGKWLSLDAFLDALINGTSRMTEAATGLLASFEDFNTELRKCKRVMWSQKHARQRPQRRHGERRGVR